MTKLLKHNQSIRSMQKLYVHLIQKLTKMLHQMISYVQTASSPRKWVIEDQASAPHEMEIPWDGYPTSQCATPYRNPKCSHIAMIAASSEEGECDRRDIVLRRRRNSNVNHNEVLDTIFSGILLMIHIFMYRFSRMDLTDGIQSKRTNGESAARRSKTTPTMSQSWYFFQAKTNFS